MTPNREPSSHGEVPPAAPSPGAGRVGPGGAGRSEGAANGLGDEREGTFWNRWIEPRHDWKAANAIVPRHLCYKVLDVFSWVSGFLGGTSIALAFSQKPEVLVSNPAFWFLAFIVSAQLIAAAFRGLPFAVRYAALATSLLAFAFIPALAVGIGPNWLFIVAMLLFSATLFFGFRTGIALTIAVLVATGGLAWGWVGGSLPVFVTQGVASTILSFRSPATWLRLLFGMSIAVAATLVVMRQLLSSLNGALNEANSALRDLAIEQESRTRALEALRSSEEKFSKVFRFSPDAISVADLETGRYIDANEGFERLFGYSRAEMIGRTASEIGHWVVAEERAGLFALLARDGSVRDHQAFGRRRDGEVRLFHVSAQLIEIAGRKALLVAGHDITDRKRAEDERARAVAQEAQARQEFTRRLIAGQEAERRRIAGDLHDSLGQNLLLVKNRAQLALAGSPIPADLRWQLENIHDLTAQAIAEVRQISHDLRPYQLDQLGLTQALEGMIDGAARSAGFRFERRLEQVDDVFPGEAATHIYRIVQESLNNILKHSGARSAQILIERDVHQTRLLIADDGSGYSPDAAVSPGDGGLGLRQIAERARILGGTLRIDAAPGRGTRIELIVKLPEAP